MNLKGKKGITLVALVVTIIVLIILAGVSISLVLGENGILTKARDGRNNYQVAANEEAVALGSLDAEIEKHATGKVSEETEEYGLRADGKFYCDPSSTVGSWSEEPRSQTGLVYEASHFYHRGSMKGRGEVEADVYYVWDRDGSWDDGDDFDVYDSSGAFLYYGGPRTRRGVKTKK